MKLQINGEQKTFDSGGQFTLAVLVESLGMKPDRVAIELNRDIVPRDRWAETSLNDGDTLELVHFVGGGSFQCDAIAVPLTALMRRGGAFEGLPSPK
ncbi:MAG TPA: sulfur carrier protein ThiS [Candidatus Binatia bacterium]|nr:sulfur carrier protein ThiS [Candidatus Binatia bacterium]